MKSPLRRGLVREGFLVILNVTFPVSFISRTISMKRPTTAPAAAQAMM